jgi:hypothetical protein
MNRQNVTKWCRDFSGGRNDVHDEQRSDRPSSITRTSELTFLEREKSVPNVARVSSGAIR